MADLDIPGLSNNGGAGSVNVPGVRAPNYQPGQAELDTRGIRLASEEVARSAMQRANALSQTFKDFSGDLNLAAGAAGQKAGQKAVEGGNAQPMSGLAGLTSYGQGYNNAVHATYEMNAKTSIEAHLADIESKTQGDPASYATQANAVIQGALKQTPEPFRTEMTPWATARVQAGVIRQQQQKADDVRNQALATYQSATPDLITGALHTAAALPGPAGDAVIAKLVQDDQDRLNALVASHVITPERAVAMHQDMVQATHNQMSGQKIDISLQPILSAMRTNVEAADKMIVQADPSLTPAENATRLQEFEKEREAYVKSQTAAHAGELAGVHQQLANGEFGRELEGHLHDLYRGGAMTEEGFFSGLAESVRNQRASVEDDTDAQLVEQTIRGERPGPLDPTDKAVVAAVGKYFDAHVALSGKISDDQYAAGAAEIFRQTGILPASVQSRIRVGLMSGDPQRAAAAAALAAKVQGVNPTADAFVSNPKLAALAGLINDGLKAGLPAGQAYSLAVARTDAPAEVRKMRDQNYAAALKAQGPNAVDLQHRLDAATPGIFSHAPPAPVGLQAQYDGLVRSFYDQTGDLGKAREIAAQQVRRTWGVSKVNGSPELMQYPVPDNLVPTVRADIASSAKAAGYTGDASQIHLVPGPYTDASGGRVFALVHVDPQTGLSDVLLDKNNRPLHYQLPSGPDFAKARQQLLEQKLTQARQLRDAQRQNSADQSMFEKQLADYYLNPRVHVMGAQ